MRLGYRVVRASRLGDVYNTDLFELWGLFAQQVAGLVEVGQPLEGVGAEVVVAGRLEA